MLAPPDDPEAPAGALPAARQVGVHTGKPDRAELRPIGLLGPAQRGLGGRHGGILGQGADDQAIQGLGVKHQPPLVRNPFAHREPLGLAAGHGGCGRFLRQGGGRIGPGVRRRRGLEIGSDGTPDQQHADQRRPSHF